MTTECTQTSFEFAAEGSRQVVARFDGGTITSDAGGLLLRQTDQRIQLLKRLAECFTDGRDPEQVEHRLEQLLAQRVFGLALGYEDLNDHDQLRADPLLAVMAGCADVTGQKRKQERDRGNPLAGKSTLNRLEQSRERPDRYRKINYDAQAIDELWVQIFLESHAEEPDEIILDLDATDTPLHGEQEGRFFHGYYDAYCYLPLYIFCGDHLLCARLRPSNIDASKGSGWEVRRIVRQIRQRWSGVRILLRADSGFARQRLMRWCEKHGVDYVFGLARNDRLGKKITAAMEQAKAESAHTGKAARVYVEFSYQTRKSWSRARRVVAKAEYTTDKENPRFVVTSLGATEWEAQALYEKLYCARGEMENRIKEQLSLFSDRMSTAKLRSNQLRLYLSSAAYVLVQALRRLALRGTDLAQAQVETIRRKLLKIGAQVRVTVRKVWVSMASSYPWPAIFAQAWRQLRC
jgi:Transposase DDE domain group 1